MLNICLSGLGKTGSQIAKYLIDTKQGKLVSAICSSESWKVGRDVGEVIGHGNIGIPIYSSDDIKSCILYTRPDVVIDFSTPFAAVKNAEIFSKMNVKIVMGTTGFSKADEKRLSSFIRKKGGLLFAPNITRGVNAMMLLTELASRILNNYDVEIIEMHHKRKRDIPSGTAKKLANMLSDSANSDQIRSQEKIPISSVRAGGIIGYHKVMLVGEYDMIEISHQSFSRDAFAEGALYAAEFISDKTGIYEMRDALNYEEIISDFLEYSRAISKPEEYPQLENVFIGNS